LLLALGLIAIASVGKFSGAFLGGALGRLSGRESLALACGMNARGSTEVIVATIGLSLGGISHDLFTMIVTMAVVTTLAMPLIAGSRGITTTILHLGRTRPQDTIKPAIEATGSSASDADAESVQRVHVTLRSNVLPAEAAVTREAQKGYDLLVLGMAKTVSPHGGFHEDIARIAAMYEGPIAVVVGRGAHVDVSQKGRLNVLVPVRRQQGIATGG
jgi:hypothetical protein